MSLQSKSASFWTRLRQQRSDLPLLPPAVFWLFISWLAIDILPLRLYRHLLHPRLRASRQSDELALIRSVRKVVSFASRCVPWRSVCFHEGIAAQQMLRRRGVSSALHFGVSPSAESGFSSHVWVTVLGNSVVGGPATGFTELATFHDLRIYPDSRPAPSDV